MKVEQSESYILHRRDYSETSLLLEIFSIDYGRVSLIAKGAKRNKKHSGTGYNLYQKYFLSWLIKAELGTLTDIDYACTVKALSAERSFAGFYMNEIILRLLHKHESHPELFFAYDKSINQLYSAEDINIVLRFFEKSLLQAMGYGLVLDCDAETGNAIEPKQKYYYHLDRGPTLTISTEKNTIPVTGKTLLQLNSNKLIDPENLLEAKVLMKSILGKYLGNKPLASRELYQAYIQNKRPV